MDELFIGLMSGTSLDGADGVLAAFPEGRVQVLAHAHRPFDPALRGELLALNTPGDNELHRAALAANALARVYGEVVTALREAAPGRAVRAIGAHGQTVRHRPGQFDGTGYTLQLNAPALLAELTGIAVVADLRSRDLAAGGQAAPLVPAFHNAQFARSGQDIAVANIGGIANLSLLGADGTVRGFDCGPGNALMDLWCLRHRGAAFDDRGRWAAEGRVLPALLEAALSDPYFALLPPKSTGRDDFHADWLDALLAAEPSASAQNVQATLCELTARTVADDVRRHLPRARELLVCGGGALNDELMRRLAQALPGSLIESTASRGLAPLHVEAAAFAWLARAHLRGEPGNLSAVTGAHGPRLLGALYPA
ncbi:MAG: anhydro-N-acetylmuramic acid kinase [Methylibium sp.]|uniref:anhydro-N-acetylmuramic acid kinase n=1 Tax=Methylibium sp. TaxID=2067992 RepID=UPI0017CF3DAB|nr:anhydro-N-acetylmuramic acid kinase [Methylibium sp.]MBA3597317.1 anhydro-N-acetylmuramic acid kinase [Methylibium sp.]